MFENFLVTFFANLAAGVVLGFLGLVGYKIIISKSAQQDVSQKNKHGDNKSTTQQVIINTTQDSSDRIIDKVLGN